MAGLRAGGTGRCGGDADGDEPMRDRSANHRPRLLVKRAERRRLRRRILLGRRL